MPDDWTRREFLKRSALAAAGLAVSGPLLSCGREACLDARKVVVVRDPAATGEGWTIDAEAVQRMMDAAVTELVGDGDVGRAWKTLLPGITSKSVVGIKVNCVVADSYPGMLVTHPEVVDAIVAGLVRMPLRGFGPENILVWDRWTAELEGGGFTINKGPEGVRCFGTTAAHEVFEEGDVGYDGNCPLSSLGDTAYFSKIVSTECDYLINVPVLKQCGVGVTFALKNNYGSFATGYPDWQSIGEVFHKEFAQRIVDVNGHPALRQKYVLTAGDALFGLKQGGPAGPPGFVYNGLIVGTDPVAADAVALSILVEEGVDPSRAQFLKAAEEAGLGVADLDRIHLVRLDAPAAQA